TVRKRQFRGNARPLTDLGGAAEFEGAPPRAEGQHLFRRGTRAGFAPRVQVFELLPGQDLLQGGIGGAPGPFPILPVGGFGRHRGVRGPPAPRRSPAPLPARRSRRIRTARASLRAPSGAGSAPGRHRRRARPVPNPPRGRFRAPPTASRTPRSTTSVRRRAW